MGYALFISHRLQRHLDEVQIASAGFASSRGWVWGGMATVLLLAMPPVTNGLIDLANKLSTGSPDMSDHGAVRGTLLRSHPGRPHAVACRHPRIRDLAAAHGKGTVMTCRRVST